MYLFIDLWSQCLCCNLKEKIKIELCHDHNKDYKNERISIGITIWYQRIGVLISVLMSAALIIDDQ